MSDKTEVKVFHLLTGDRLMVRGEGCAEENDGLFGMCLLLNPAQAYRVHMVQDPQGGARVLLSRLDTDVLTPEESIRLQISNIVFSYTMDPKNELVGQLDEVDKQISAKKAGLILPGVNPPPPINNPNVKQFPTNSGK